MIFSRIDIPSQEHQEQTLTLTEKEHSTGGEKGVIGLLNV